jgi:hypothetical protein
VNPFGGNQEKAEDVQRCKRPPWDGNFSEQRRIRRRRSQICRRFRLRTTSDDMYHITTCFCQQPGMHDEAQQFNVALNHSC